MDKNNYTTYNHSINLIERKNVLVTGVKKIESFDEFEFIMDTIMGMLNIKGEGLELIKLDTIQGEVSIKGLINSFSYNDNEKNNKKETGIMSRLFK